MIPLTILLIQILFQQIPLKFKLNQLQLLILHFDLIIILKFIQKFMILQNLQLRLLILHFDLIIILKFIQKFMILLKPHLSLYLFHVIQTKMNLNRLQHLILHFNHEIILMFNLMFSHLNLLHHHVLIKEVVFLRACFLHQKIHHLLLQQ